MRQKTGKLGMVKNRAKEERKRKGGCYLSCYPHVTLVVCLGINEVMTLPGHLQNLERTEQTLDRTTKSGSDHQRSDQNGHV